MWLQEQTTLLKNHTCNSGEDRTIRQVLLSDFAKDINTICALHKLDRHAEDYKKRKKQLKSKLHCWAPSALFQSRRKAISSLRNEHRCFN